MQTKRPQPLSANDGGASVIPHIARAASEQYGCKKSFASTAPSQIRAVFLNRENRPMISAKKISIAAVTFVLARAVGLPAQATTAADTPLVTLAQAMVPPTGMMDAEHPMPTKERMLKRFPQPVRVGDLIGLPVLNENASTLGHVRQVVRTPQGNIELIVSYSRLWGWFGRPVAVPLEVVGIAGRQLVSLDMDPSEYANAPTWQAKDAIVLPNDATIRIALARS
jgi:sporulation protein YlmC with PRC-barrel domain